MKSSDVRRAKAGTHRDQHTRAMEVVQMLVRTLDQAQRVPHERARAVVIYDRSLLAFNARALVGGRR